MSRFLDIPPEIRNRIYSFCFSHTKDEALTYNLRNFKDPAITKINRQIRHESLPILFAQCHWMVTVGANYLDPSSARDCGNLGLLPRNSFKLRKAGNAVIFRSLTIHIANPIMAPHLRRHALNLDSKKQTHIIVTLEIGMESGLVMKVEQGPAGKSSLVHFRRLSFAERMRDMQIDKTITAAEEVITKIKTRENFKGLTLSDLDKMAKSFRL